VNYCSSGSHHGCDIYLKLQVHQITYNMARRHLQEQLTEALERELTLRGFLIRDDSAPQNGELERER